MAEKLSPRREISEQFKREIGVKRLYEASAGDLLKASSILERAQQEANIQADSVIGLGNDIANIFGGAISETQNTSDSMHEAKNRRTKKSESDTMLMKGIKAQERSERAAVAAFMRWHKDSLDNNGIINNDVLEQVKAKNEHLYDVLRVRNNRIAEQLNLQSGIPINSKDHEEGTNKSFIIKYAPRIGLTTATAAITFAMLGSGLENNGSVSAASIPPDGRTPTTLNQSFSELHKTTPVACIPTDLKGRIAYTGNHVATDPVVGFFDNIAANPACSDTLYFDIYGSNQSPESPGWLESQHFVSQRSFEVPDGKTDVKRTFDVPDAGYCNYQVEVVRTGEIKNPPYYSGTDMVDYGFVKGNCEKSPTATATKSPTPKATATNSPTPSPTVHRETRTPTPKPEVKKTATPAPHTERLPKTGDAPEGFLGTLATVGAGLSAAGLYVRNRLGRRR